MMSVVPRFPAGMSNTHSSVYTSALLLAQVEKKFKSKNRYRFVFKSGIMQIDGLEYVFEKGNGDFNW